METTTLKTECHIQWDCTHKAKIADAKSLI